MFHRAWLSVCIQGPTDVRLPHCSAPMQGELGIAQFTPCLTVRGDENLVLSITRQTTSLLYRDRPNLTRHCVYLCIAPSFQCRNSSAAIPVLLPSIEHRFAAAIAPYRSDFDDNYPDFIRPSPISPVRVAGAKHRPPPRDLHARESDPAIVRWGMPRACIGSAWLRHRFCWTL